MNEDQRAALDDVRQIVNLIGQAAVVAFSAWYVWILLPPAVRITVLAELHRLRQPFALARERKSAAADLWRDVIDLQTNGIPERWVGAA